MSSLDNMKARLNYHGGGRQIDRMNEDKLRSLKKALLYSYQSATVELADGRQFRALINHDKLKVAYEDKIISIPFKDICLNKEFSGEKTPDAEEVIGMKAGDTFKWIPLHEEYMEPTYWIVYLQYSEETAYFRGEIREAPTELEIEDEDGNSRIYHTWFKGPEQEAIEWRSKHRESWNELNYTRIMYVTKDELTTGYFHRFQILTIEGNRWQVEAVNEAYGDNIIKVALHEYFNDNLPDTEHKSTDDLQSEIHGDSIVYPYDTRTYEAPYEDLDNNKWTVSDDSLVKIKEQDGTKVTLYIKSPVSGKFVLTYGDDLTKEITIGSL